MKEIRILRIVNRFNLGGITYNVSYLSRYLPPQFRTLLAGGPEEEGELNSLFIPHSLGLEPLLIAQMRRRLNPFADLAAYLELRRLIREFKPHIVHTHASKAGALGRLAAAHCRVPVIVHTFHGHVFHGYFGKFTTHVYKAAERYLARRSDAIVVISESQKKAICGTHRICPEAKAHVIPLGFDLRRFREDQDKKRARFRSELGIGDAELAVGIVGRLAPVKNHGMFVRAAAACIRKDGRRVRAIIVGDGETRPQVEQAISAAGKTFARGASPDADFILAGWRKDVDTVLAGLDIVCLTSWNEGTPVSLIEAQAAGRFIVTTDAGGVRDILHAGAGFLSAPGDEQAFRRNLMQAVAGFDSLSKQAGEASEAVIGRFSYARLCNDMQALYLKLLEEKKKSVT